MTHSNRLSLAVIAAVALAPLTASAQTRTSSTQLSAASSNPALGAPVGAMDYSFLLGLELNQPEGYNAGFKLAGEGMYEFMNLNPQTRLSLGGRIGFSHHGSDFDTSFWILEAVPDARIKFAVAPQVAVYGDIGMGLAMRHVSFPGGSDDTAGLAVQLGFGGALAVNPNINLLAEFRLDLYTWTGASTLIAFPTIGIQFH